MSEELNCMNCSIGDFKHNFCDCNNGFCKEFKSIGKQEDFFNAVMQRVRPQGEWIKDNLGTVICSECKRPRRDSRVNHINFCNSCGARMKDVTEGLESRTDLIWYGDKTDLIGDETGRHTGWFWKGADDETD